IIDPARTSSRRAGYRERLEFPFDIQKRATLYRVRQVIPDDVPDTIDASCRGQITAGHGEVVDPQRFVDVKRDPSPALWRTAREADHEVRVVDAEDLHALVEAEEQKPVTVEKAVRKGRRRWSVVKPAHKMALVIDAVDDGKIRVPIRHVNLS